MVDRLSIHLLYWYQ